MSAGTGVLGFDYTAGIGISVRMTVADWRTKYPPDQFRRVAEGGETAYYRRTVGGGRTSNRVAEAYAIIPAGRPSK